MSFKEFVSLHNYTETETLSCDNHILHIAKVDGLTLEIDEDLESMKIVDISLV